MTKHWLYECFVTQQCKLQAQVYLGYIIWTMPLKRSPVAVIIIKGWLIDKHSVLPDYQKGLGEYIRQTCVQIVQKGLEPLLLRAAILVSVHSCTLYAKKERKSLLS